jgi:anti-anti-sigma factor
MSTRRLLGWERQGDVLIVTPLESVSTLDSWNIRNELDAILESLRQHEVRHVIVDLSRAEYFGTCLLEAMHALWRLARTGGGKMALCNLTPTGREILVTVKLDKLWPICASQTEALEALQ